MKNGLLLDLLFIQPRFDTLTGVRLRLGRNYKWRGVSMCLSAKELPGAVNRRT